MDFLPLLKSSKLFQNLSKTTSVPSVTHFRNRKGKLKKKTGNEANSTIYRAGPAR